MFRKLLTAITLSVVLFAGVAFLHSEKALAYNYNSCANSSNPGLGNSGWDTTSSSPWTTNANIGGIPVAIQVQEAYDYVNGVRTFCSLYRSISVIDARGRTGGQVITSTYGLSFGGPNDSDHPTNLSNSWTVYDNEFDTFVSGSVFGCGNYGCVDKKSVSATMYFHNVGNTASGCFALNTGSGCY